MIDTTGIYDLRGTAGPHTGASRPIVAERNTSASVRSPTMREYPADGIAPTRNERGFATAPASLLGAMFHRMGGSTTSTAKGAYVDLTV